MDIVLNKWSSLAPHVQKLNTISIDSLFLVLFHDKYPISCRKIINFFFQMKKGNDDDED